MNALRRGHVDLVASVAAGIIAVVVYPARAQDAPAPASSAPSTKPAADSGLKPTFSIDLGGGVAMDFVLIRPGSSMMGSEKGSDDNPIHKVTITQPFYMGVCEVTQAQYEKVMGTNPSYFRLAGVPPFKDADFPVESVSWNNAAEFCRKLTEKFANPCICRLPTEAEWEYACRAGGTSDYCFGDGEAQLGDYAWYSANSSQHTHPVKTKRANAWGLFDMHGNIFEWCQDFSSSIGVAQSDPQGPSSGVFRIVRGGGWNSAPDICRAASRFLDPPALPARLHRLSGGFGCADSELML